MTRGVEMGATMGGGLVVAEQLATAEVVDGNMEGGGRDELIVNAF